MQKNYCKGGTNYRTFLMQARIQGSWCVCKVVSDGQAKAKKYQNLFTYFQISDLFFSAKSLRNPLLTSFLKLKAKQTPLPKKSTVSETSSKMTATELQCIHFDGGPRV